MTNKYLVHSNLLKKKNYDPVCVMLRMSIE